MSIERSRDRLRSSGLAARNPRPDGISRRVALAARDRQTGPLPEQVPTGWHRHTFDNPTRPVSPLTDRPRHQVGRVLDPLPGRGRKPVLVLTGVLGLVAAAGAVVTLVVSVGPGVPPAPDPVPAESVTALPATIAPTTTPLPVTAPSATPRPVTAPSTTPPPVTAPAAPAAPAVVSTLTPGDPGFGWPSTAFGSPQP